MLTDREWSELFSAYCDCMSFMDAQLGRVLDALDKNRLWDNPVVVFVGDHGYHTGERQWWNKNTLFERSCRAPPIIAAPGMKGSQVNRSLVEFVDIYPTIADFCGLKVPHTNTGTSLRPVLANPVMSVKDAAFTLIDMDSKFFARSVRTARWRFTRWSDGQTELYDHDHDPEESCNVVWQNPSAVKELAVRIQTLP